MIVKVKPPRAMMFVDLGTVFLRIDQIREIYPPGSGTLARVWHFDGSDYPIADGIYSKLIAALATHPSIQVHRLVLPSPPFEPGDDES